MELYDALEAMPTLDAAILAGCAPRLNSRLLINAWLIADKRSADTLLRIAPFMLGKDIKRAIQTCPDMSPDTVLALRAYMD